ncbi:hypothetical protein [Cellulosimicrobium sp. NPDC057127]
MTDDFRRGDSAQERSAPSDDDRSRGRTVRGGTSGKQEHDA